MVDTRYELAASRREVDEALYYCPSCMMERWEGGMFCWNEDCKASPVYWRLPGARGKPLTPRKPVVFQPPPQPQTASFSDEAGSGAPALGPSAALAPAKRRAKATPAPARRVSSKKWKVDLIDNVPSVGGNNWNYLPYHKNKDTPSPYTAGKDVQEYNYYYEHPAVLAPLPNPVVTEDLVNRPFSQILGGGGHAPGSVAAAGGTPGAIAELNLSTEGGHAFVSNDEANKLCQSHSIIADELDDDI